MCGFICLKKVLASDGVGGQGVGVVVWFACLLAQRARSRFTVAVSAFTKIDSVDVCKFHPCGGCQ